MSHAATNWAIRQRGLKPAAKIVLWHLCDRYHPDNGCFPSQEALAEDAEMSRSALNNHLAALEDAGLIRREQHIDPETRRRERTHYRFPFESDWPGAKPCSDSGHGEPMSENAAEPCPENDESHVRNPDNINPVREPVREPVIEREGAGTREQVPHADLLAKLQAVAIGLSHDSPSAIVAEWRELSPAERHEAVERYLDWIEDGRQAKRKVFPGLPVYLAERRWTLLPPKAGRGAGGRFVAPAFSRDWWIIWHKRVAAGKPVGPMVEQARRGLPWGADPEPIDAEREAFVKIFVGSAEWHRLCRHFAARGITMPKPDLVEWVSAAAELLGEDIAAEAERALAP